MDQLHSRMAETLHGHQGIVEIDIEIDIECLLTHVLPYGVLLLVLPDEIMDIMKKAIPIN